MTNETVSRLSHLRAVMKKNRLDAVIIPTADPHMTEYLPIHWRLRAWLSGFEGSAGTLIVTMGSAALWTDSRYWIDAANILKGSEIELMKQGLPDTPSFSQWLKKNLKKNARVAYDPLMVGYKDFETRAAELADAGIALVTLDGLCGKVWVNRPAAPTGKVMDYAVKYAGESRASKLKRLRKAMQEKKTDTNLISSSYDIAWLFNLRGSDTPHTPIFAAFALIGMKEATIFAETAKFSASLIAKLAKDGVTVRPYDEITDALRKLSSKTTIMLAPQQTVKALADAIPAKTKKLEIDILPSNEMKAVKNETELQWLREAAVSDGVILTTFFASIETFLAEGVTLTEYDAVTIMDQIRSMYSRGLSFNSIIAYNANAAMAHYSAKPENAAKLKRQGMLLADTGSQYYGATTDVTRTVALGPTTKEMRSDYTLVLKGLLRLTRAVFPVGTSGTQLDTLAREDLWQNNLNFLHGTGHGIGSYLNVHEGPHGISGHPAGGKISLKPGMLITNEPGMYREGKHGIRIENIIHVTPQKKSEFGTFLAFETMTLFPFDSNLIERDLLTDVEIRQINDYHQRVYKLVAPKLSPLLRRWLKAKTTAL